MSWGFYTSAGSQKTGSGMVNLGTFTVGSTSLTFSSIPQSYSNLRVIWIAQGSRASYANTGGRFTINGATTYYDQIYTTSTGSAALASQSSWYIGQIPTATRTNDNYVCNVIIDIPSYAKTNMIKGFSSTCSGHDGTTQLNAVCCGTNRADVAAVTSIALTDDVASTPGTRSFAQLWAY